MVLSLTNISKRYRIAGGRRTILDGVDLSIEPGGIVAVTGKSGCGKTTLLNVIAGLAVPDHGAVRINGRRLRYFLDIMPARTRNRDIGFIFQTFRLLNDQTVMANVLLPARIRGRAGRDTRRYADELLGRLLIYQYRRMRAGILSGGQKQRVAIARALVNRPSLVLADEPTANLDRKTAHEIFDVIEGLREAGTAVLMVTHDEYMHARADAVYTLENGILRPGT